MADPPTYPETTSTEETDRGGGGTRPRMPRWVRVFVIIAIVLAMIVVVGLLTGKLGPGGPHGPGRHLGGRTQSTPTSAQQGSGVGAPADASAGTRTVEVATLDTMAYQPAAMTVSAGETVTFVVTNSGKTVHEFTLGDAAMQQQHAQAMSHLPAGAPHGFPNSITLQPGETKRLTWRFGDTSLEYACHQPGHYDGGMRGQITVS